jgi:hypothetical protein
MNTIKLTTVSSTLRAGNYESPEVKVAEIYSEGVLCVSNGSIEEWKDGNSFTWDQE